MFVDIPYTPAADTFLDHCVMFIIFIQFASPQSAASGLFMLDPFNTQVFNGQAIPQINNAMSFTDPFETQVFNGQAIPQINNAMSFIDPFDTQVFNGQSTSNIFTLLALQP